MNILSLNVNNLGGISEKPRIDEGFVDIGGNVDWIAFRKSINDWRSDSTHIINAKEILAQIKDYNSDIVVLHEFDISSLESKWLINELKKNSYNIIYPDKTSAKDFSRSLSSITVMFIKDKTLNSCKNPIELKERYKWNQIEYEGKIIIGVHVPYNIKFWDTIIKYYKENNKKKLIIIGDMNVYSNNTSRKDKFDELLKLGAIDVWTQEGNPTNIPTFNSGLRIDYALMTPSLYDNSVNMMMEDDLRKKGFTDHSTIIIDF